MKKITILGNPGAGKSTLAKQLGQLLDIPVHHMDAIYWKPGWKPIDEAELMSQHDEILKHDTWIIEGNYSVTLQKRLKNADTVIFLNYSTIKCLSGIIKRRIQYHNKTRPDIGKGCPERLNLEFVLWTKNYNKNKAPKMYQKLLKTTNTNIHIFRKRKQLTTYLESLRQDQVI